MHRIYRETYIIAAVMSNQEQHLLSQIVYAFQAREEKFPRVPVLDPM